jgi:hypothetical protein
MQSCALTSSSTLAVGQSFGSFSPHGARSKGDQQPDGRVAHNQKLQNILGVDIGSLATQVLRARKTRKMVLVFTLRFLVLVLLFACLPVSLAC